MPISTRSKRRKTERTNDLKWTETLMDAGWTSIPSVLLECQHKIGLDAVDVNIIMHLAKHWWTHDRLPYPSKQTIAECMNMDASTVRRHIQKLEFAGLIERKARFDGKHGGQMNNEYDLSGLIKELTPYAEEIIRERQDRDKAKAERHKRKLPMRIVS